MIITLALAAFVPAVVVLAIAVDVMAMAAWIRGSR
jgi:hypothetical protein